MLVSRAYLCGMQSEDTIVALATGGGVGAISVVRISGSEAVIYTDSLLKKPISGMASHTLALRKLYDEEGLIDEAVISLFLNNRSYTGENVIEISLHGSAYISQRLLRAYLKLGARMAEPGEFTRRAFLNGKMDLAQAEAVADLIAAEHKFAHEQALHQLRGGFSDDIKLLRSKLLHFTSLIELELDFGEEDVEFASRSDLMALVVEIKRQVDELKDSFALGNALKQGFALVLAGRPNAGKSTLFNALLNEDKAIVSEIAGTTRDALEDKLRIGDVSVRLIDTAGIREATDAIEREGINRTFKHIESAGASLYLFDPSGISVADLRADLAILKERGKRIWACANKLDIFNGDLADYKVAVAEVLQEELWELSAHERASVSLLRGEIAARFSQDIAQLGQLTVVTNARHSAALELCSEELQMIIEGIESGLSGDLMSFHLRTGIRALADITGEIDNEEVLGEIFSSFCIGK